MRAFTRAVPAFCVALCLAAGPLAAQQRQLRVVATNTWTAAFAAAAGATNVATIAPADLRHPAEYELKPSDVEALQGADLLVYAGFEVMAKKLADAAGSRKIPMVQIAADYSLATLRSSILAIATATGTVEKARSSIADLERFMESWKLELRAAGLAGAEVVTHVFQQPLMAELGLAVKGAFGPAPLEAAQIMKLSPLKAAFIVDNWHNEVAGPLRETMKESRYLSLVNFPGPDGTSTLLDVLRDNRDRLMAAARREAP